MAIFEISRRFTECLGEILSKPDYLDSFTAVKHGGGKRATEARVKE